MSLTPPILHLSPLPLAHHPYHQHSPYNHNYSHQLHRNVTHS